jgi:hypothetical protein
MAGKLTKWPQNMPITSIARPSKIYPNWDFWFENMPSGNPALAWRPPKQGRHQLFRAQIIIRKVITNNICDSKSIFKPC